MPKSLASRPRVMLAYFAIFLLSEASINEINKIATTQWLKHAWA